MRLAALAILSAVMVVGMSVWDAPRAAAGPLSDAPEGLVVPDRNDQDRSATIRSRYTTINFDVLPDPRARGLLRQPPRTLPLQLFPNLSITAVFERFDPNREGVTWVGHVDAVPFSSVTLVYGRGLLTGSVVMPTASYAIRPAPAELRRLNPLGTREIHVVTEIRQEGFAPEAPPIEVDLADAGGGAADAPMADTGDSVDVMVVYTALAQARAGGEAGIANLINLAISETNTSYEASGVTVRLRLVHHAPVDYQEPSDFGAALSALRAGTGALSGIAATRTAVGADLVAMLIHPQAPSACGIAFLMTTVSVVFAQNGFSVTDTDCIANYTFAHELGHNMGARHDWFVDTGVTPFSYAHGFVNPAPGQRWRTIMAYPDHCQAMGFNCTRLLRWANASQRLTPECGGDVNCNLMQYWIFPGAPMGVPGGTSTSCPLNSVSANTCDADDSRTLNATAFSVANFRQAVADRR
jgi:hypothetical protein